jgi:dienelactone hydrolase
MIAGFSNGGGMAEHVATVRPVRGVLMLSGALPLAMLGGDAWPAGGPAQIHYAVDDPSRPQEWIDAVVDDVRGRWRPGRDLRLPGCRTPVHGRLAAR